MGLTRENLEEILLRRHRVEKATFKVHKKTERDGGSQLGVEKGSKRDSWAN